jgi:hypothetical protein
VSDRSDIRCGSFKPRASRRSPTAPASSGTATPPIAACCNGYAHPTSRVKAVSTPSSNRPITPRATLAETEDYADEDSGNVHATRAVSVAERVLAYRQRVGECRSALLVREIRLRESHVEECGSDTVLLGFPGDA